MAPKKTQRSALWYYAQENMQKAKCTNMKDAIEALYVEWKSLPVTEKLPYETKYNEWKRQIKIEPVINKVPGLKTEAVYTEESSVSAMTREAEMFVENLQKGHNDERLINNPFYFIKFQSFCKCDEYKDVSLDYKYRPYYVLAEVALIEFSLKNGIQKEYHSFIKPNKIPLGYRATCMENARDNLGEMPLEGMDNMNKGWDEIFEEIKAFISPDNDTNNNSKSSYDHLKAVFCMPNDITETKFAMDFLYDRFIKNPANKSKCLARATDKVLNLETLVNKLAKVKLSTYSTANDLLSSFAFDYTMGSRCQWHEEKGTLNCSLGFVKKYAYLIADGICQLFDIKLTEKHVPQQIEPVGMIVSSTEFRKKSDRFRSTLSSRNSFSYVNGTKSTSSKIDDDDDDDVQYQDSVESESIISYNPPKRPTYPSTDIRCLPIIRSNTVSSIDSTIRTKMSFPFVKNEFEKRLGSNVKAEGNRRPGLVESPSNMTVPNGLNEENNDDGWITKTSSKSRKIDVEHKITDDHTSDNISTLSGSSTKTSTSGLKHAFGRGKKF